MSKVDYRKCDECGTLNAPEGARHDGWLLMTGKLQVAGYQFSMGHVGIAEGSRDYCSHECLFKAIHKAFDSVPGFNKRSVK